MDVKQQDKNYSDMDDVAKKELIEDSYIIKHMSFQEIANMLKTYPNKIRRDAKKFGIKSRTRAKAQQLALTEGRKEHPTKGKVRDINTKYKISEGRAKAWKNMTEEERNKVVESAKEQWKNMSEEQRNELQRSAGDAIRKAAKEGSKLEKFIYKELINNHYKVEFHKERFINNETLQIDLWLPELSTAIEIDGLSHSKPIWGMKAFHRNKKSDSVKSGLLLGSGAVLIRLIQTKTLSQKYKRDILTRLLNKLQEINDKFPEHNNRHIVIEDNDL